MKVKRLLVLAAMAARAFCGGRANAQDDYEFSAVSPSGHTLWYHQLSSTQVYVGSPMGPYGSEGYTPSAMQGSLTIPGTVTGPSGTTYTVVQVGGEDGLGGDVTFSNCTGLTAVNFPNTLLEIEHMAFLGCTGLTTITVASGGKFDSRNGCNAVIETATNTLVFGCKGSTVPSSVTSIGGSAFAGCTGLTSISLPSGLTSIGGSAFDGCTGLTSINLPSSLTSIGGSAFAGCTGLTSISLPISLTSIGGSAFAGCTGLTSIDFPGSLTTIGSYAFRGCTGLTTAGLPSRLTSLGEGAFSGCTGLTAVAIPNVTTMGSNVFSGCTSVGSAELGMANIPSGVLQGCSQLTRLVLGPNVRTIAADAFSGLNAVLRLSSRATTPPTATANPFTGFNTGIQVYVPCESVEAYKNAPYWGFFTNIQCSNAGIAEVDGSAIRLHVSGGRIVMEGADGMGVAVYSLDGRPADNGHLQPGIYMVRIGTLPARKVVVQ